MGSSIRMWFRRAVVGLVAAGTSLVIASPVLGHEVTVRDARGDMWVIEEGSTEPDPAPAARIGDFVRTTFEHTGTRVVVRSKFVRLERTGRRFIVWTDLQAGDGRRWFAGVRMTPRDRDGSTQLFTGNGVDVECNLNHRVDYRRDTVRLGIPGRCLDTPRMLRFAQLSQFSRHSLRFARVDDPLSHQASRQTWTGWVRHG